MKGTILCGADRLAMIEALNRACFAVAKGRPHDSRQVAIDTYDVETHAGAKLGRVVLVRGPKGARVEWSRG